MSNQIKSPNKFRVIINFLEKTTELFKEFDHAEGKQSYVAAEKCYAFVYLSIYENEFSEYTKEMKALTNQLQRFVRDEVTKESVFEIYTQTILEINEWVIKENAKRREMRILLEPIFKKHYKQLMEEILDLLVISE